MKPVLTKKDGRTAATMRGRDHRSPKPGRFRFSSIMVSLALLATTLVGLEVGSSPVAALSGFEQHVPILKEAKANGTYVSLKWDLRSDQKGVNVYRNGAYLKSYNNGETVWNDYDGEQGYKYYIVAVSKNGEFSKKSIEKTATGGGEVSGVKNLQIAKESSTKIKLTWKATSTAVKEFHIYRGQTHFWTTKASTTNPGGTYTFYHNGSTLENAPLYWVRPVAHNGTKGDGAAILSPITEEFFKSVQTDERLRATARSKPSETVPAGTSQHSQNLAADVASTRAEAYRTGTIAVVLGGQAALATVAAGIASVGTVGVTAPLVIVGAGISVAGAGAAAYEFEKAMKAKAAAQEAYDKCMASSSCRYASVRRPTDDNSSDSPSTSPSSGNSGREPDKGTSHTGTDGV